MSSFYKHVQESKEFMSNLPLSPERNSNLCKLLSEENISIVYSNVKTASFNVISRILTIPKWRNMSAHVIDRIIIHEVGHALFTTDWVELTAYESKQARSATNILEDRRVDNLMKKRFPGVAKDYFEAAKDIVSLDLFKLEGKDINKMCFLDRANMLSKIGLNKGVIKFEKFEKEWLKKIDSTKSTEEVRDLAIWILSEIERMKKEAEEKKEEEKKEEKEENEEPSVVTQEESSKGESDGNTEEGDEPAEENEPEEENNPGEGDETAEENEPEEGDEDDEKYGIDEVEGEEGEEEGLTYEAEEESEENDKPEQGEEPEEPEGAPSNTPTGHDDEIETDECFEDMQEDIDTYDQAYAPICRDIEIDTKEFVVSWKVLSKLNRHLNYDGDFMTDEMAKEVKKEALQLHREFSIKKEANVQNVFYSNRGTLDMSRLAEYKTNDEIFERKMKRVSNDSDHKFFFLIDYSASMRGTNIKFAMRQLAVFRTFCKMAGVEFSAYLFCSNHSFPEKTMAKIVTISPDVMEYYCDDVKLLEITNETQSDIDFHSMIARTVNGDLVGAMMGCTPLTSSIKIVRLMMKQEKAQFPDKKLNFVLLTDGQENVPVGNNLIMEDRDKVQYHVEKQSWTIQLKMMKKVANSVIGFAIPSDNTFFNLAKAAMDPNNYKFVQHTRNEMNRVGYVNVTAEGFDSMFLIKSNVKVYSEADIDREYDFDKITAAGITTAFKKLNMKKMVQKKITSEISKIIS